MKKTISELEESVQSAKARQEEAKTEIKKLEKDIDEFKNNKEGKIDELKVFTLKASYSCRLLIRIYSVQAEIKKLKTTLQKQSVQVKTEQKELQTARLELGELVANLQSTRC